MPLSRTQQAIAKMVSNNIRHKWQDYSSDDRSSARSFILSRASKPAHKEKKELFTIAGVDGNNNGFNALCEYIPSL